MIPGSSSLQTGHCSGSMLTIWRLCENFDENMAPLTGRDVCHLLQSVLQSRSLGTRNSEAVVSQTKFHSVRIQRGLDVRCSVAAERRESYVRKLQL